jgi:hypothetical protein
MMRGKIWYVIVDGGRARFVERDDGGAFRTVSSLVAAELHKRSHDLGLDRPPRAKESASPARHAIEPRRDLHQASKRSSSSSWPTNSAKSMGAVNSISSFS